MESMNEVVTRQAAEVARLSALTIRAKGFRKEMYEHALCFAEQQLDMAVQAANVLALD